MRPCFVFRWCLSLLLLLPPALCAAPPPREALGEPVLGDDGTSAVFRYPDGPRGWIKHGFRVEHDGTRDWRAFRALQFDLQLPDDAPVDVRAVVLTPGQMDETEGVTAEVAISGAGWHTVRLPWTSFAFEQARSAFLKHVKEVRVTVRGPGGAPRKVTVRNAALVGGEVLSLRAPVLGRSAAPGGTAGYTVEVGNATLVRQAVTLAFERRGWEGFEPTVEPARFELAPGETREVTVRVPVPARVPPGAHERQILRATGNGDAGRAATVTLVTAAALAHPYVLHTPARWQEVKARVAAHAWAREGQAEYVKRAEAWVVPEVARPPGNDPGDTMGPYLFRTQNEADLMACGIAYQLTGDKRFAEKIALFLRRLSSPADGYPVTLRGCNQGLVQEGHFFQHIAMAYDMVGDAEVFTPQDRVQIERTFRLFMETVAFENEKGSINNWNVSEVVGAFYCALVLQDLAAAEQFFAGPAGIVDQLAKGTMDDGWWYECSISYNVWCATEFTQVALAYEPWGINFRDTRVPASYAREALLSAPGGRSDFNGGSPVKTNDLAAARKPFGMNKELWGPLRRPYREIRDLWNGLLPFVDYRGVMFGVNDSTENRVAGQPFEVAYYAYREPAYAAMIKRAGKRDLLYGVPELPAVTPELYRTSAYADNVGVAMLRSQTPGRPQREQIQAVLHYGTHGWAHGHFDRTGLLSLMRYGRSFYNPEMVWYSYEPFMYKFYVQTSVSKNMVVVDQKMQEATESSRLLFHTGAAMQATVVETTSRWSDPPYGGMVYDYVPVKTFEEKTWREGRHVPIPADAPVYGSLNRFTEPVRQRRLMVVTDDYVLLADHVTSTTGAEHTYENLLQMKGFRGLAGAGKRHLRHAAQWNADPVGSAQFVTDVDWFAVQAPARSRFDMRWGPGADNDGTRAPHSEEGLLALEVHTLWPRAQEIMIGTVPEEHGVQKRLFYTVRGDGRTLAEGRFGAWILGRAELDVSVEGVQTLELETRIELGTKPTIFWAGARIATADGREVPLSRLPVEQVNVLAPPRPGADYFGGPVKIQGTAFTDATPGQPQNAAQPALVRVNLAGLGARRFRSAIGGDYPLGDESQRRKTYGVRVSGKQARFLTVIEPHEGTSVVAHAEALDADRVRVTLADGRVQEIALRGFEDEDAAKLGVTLTETKDGQVLRNESTP